MSPHRRPDYSPEQRLAIVQLMRLCDWSLKTTASRFVLHENTIRTWRQMIEGKRSSTTLLGIPRWNLIDDAVRWAVQELRRLFPEQEFGSRTIARHLIRAGIAISRRSVQRICREENHIRPGSRRQKPPLTPPAGAVPDHLLTPETPNRVWHLDLAELHILWLRFSIAVLLDGCSRRSLRLTIYRGAPTSDDMIALMQDTAHEHGRPGFLITDHGCQFRSTFRDAIKTLGIRHVRGKVRCPSFNGKAERLIRTLRGYLQRSLLPISTSGIQLRLDQFRGWYNAERPHAALAGRTPDDVWHDRHHDPPLPYRARDDCPPTITIQRLAMNGDRHLPLVRIGIAVDAAA